MIETLDGHPEPSELAAKILAAIGDERDPRKIAAAMATALYRCLDGVELPPPHAVHELGVDARGRTVSVMVHDHTDQDDGLAILRMTHDHMFHVVERQYAQTDSRCPSPVG